MRTSLNPVVCSSDAFIERIAAKTGQTYNEAFKSTVDHADKAFRRHVKMAIRSGRHIVIDRTNMSRKSRARVVRLFESTGYRLEAIVFKNVFWTQWASRLKSRVGKDIPAVAIGSMLLSYEEPSEHEGFNNVYYN